MFPGNPEVCDGKDNDCDGAVDDVSVGTASIRASKAAPATATYSWSAVSGAATYDAVYGGLAVLRSTGGGFKSAVTGCLANDAAATAFSEGSTPPVGDGLWYLVRANNICGVPGTYDDPSPPQVDDRDAEIGAAGGACP
jgi:hypothetical protein